MTQGQKAGGSEPLGPGEQQEKARRTRKAWIIGGATVVGMIAGVATGYRDAGHFFDASNPWPPALAVGLAISYLVVVIAGGIALARHTDEFELQRQYRIVAAAALVYALIYPVWFVLWMGGLVPEPMHAVLFLTFWLSMFGAFLFYRFR